MRARDIDRLDPAGRDETPLYRNQPQATQTTGNRTGSHHHDPGAPPGIGCTSRSTSYPSPYPRRGLC